jgi:hypothetical protein
MISRSALFLLLFIALVVSECVAGVAPIEPDQLAGVLGFPGGRVRVEDKTERVREGAGGNTIIAAHFYSSPERSFAPIRIIVGKERTLFTEKLESQVEQGLKQLESKGTPTTLRRIRVGTEGRGFAGMALVGPGGSQERVLLTLPQQHKDIEIMITIPNERPLKLLPEAQSYYEMLAKGTVSHKLVEIANAVVNQDIPTKPAEEIPQSASVPSSAVTLPTQNGEISDVQSPSVSAPGRRSYWPWVLAAGALLAVCLLLALGRRAR